MDTTQNKPLLSPKGTFPATIAKVIDDYKLVINRGSENGIKEGQRMLVYCVSDEDIKDPETGESLGFLELVRGTGKIIFVQDKLSIIETDKQRDIKRVFNANKPFQITAFDRTETIIEYTRVPFDNPRVGDLVKPI